MATLSDEISMPAEARGEKGVEEEGTTLPAETKEQEGLAEDDILLVSYDETNEITDIF